MALMAPKSVLADKARWSPDDQLVPAILAGGKRKDGMKNLADPDRCWVVAGLTLAGLTAESICDRLDCCLRQVRLIRAMDMTQVCMIMQTESRNFTDELRLARGELVSARQDNEVLGAELARTKNKLTRLIDGQIVGHKICGKCGTPMDRYNTYIHQLTGKEYCRECHRRRQKSYRDSRKLEPVEIADETLLHTGALEVVLPVAVTHRA